MKIARTFRFEASHSLPYHDGPCRGLHGHSYRLELILCGPVHPLMDDDPQSGFVVDFGRVQEVVQGELIEAFLDHHHLNESLPGLVYPSAEHLAIWILTWCLAHLDGRPEMGSALVQQVRLWETERAWVEIDRHEIPHLSVK